MLSLSLSLSLSQRVISLFYSIKEKRSRAVSSRLRNIFYFLNSLAEPEKGNRYGGFSRGGGEKKINESRQEPFFLYFSAGVKGHFSAFFGQFSSK